MSAEPASGDIARPINPLCASLRFRGAHAGRIEVVASTQFAQNLRKRLDGSLRAPAEADPDHESLKQLVRTVANNMVPHLVNGSGGSLDLSDPTLHSVDTELDWPNLAASRGTRLLQVEGQLLAARIVDLD